MEQKKITGHQLFSITANAAIGGSIIVIAASVASVAKQDAWISALVTPAFGLAVIGIYWVLGSRYQEMTLIGMIRKILGKWAGSLVSAGYVALFVTTSYHLPWYLGDFTGHVMFETPRYVLNLAFVAVLVIAVLYGVEAIARACELFVVFVSVVFFASIILVMPNIRIEYAQPILENGIAPVLKGAVFLSGIVTFPLVSLLMIYPLHVSDIPGAKKALFKGYLWGCLIVFTAILMCILVLGSTISGKSNYPTLLLAREIHVGIIFTRLEYAISLLWLVTQFVIGVLFFYGGVTGLSELLGLKDHKKIVMPMGLIVLVLSGIVFPDNVYQANWVNLVWTPYIIVFGLVLPVLLLIVDIIKKWAVKG